MICSPNNTFSLRSKYASISAIAVLLLLVSSMAFAQQASLPYEDGLLTFRTSLEGPVPFIISLVGIVACGAMLIFGGEISGFLRTMLFIVLVVSIIVQASNVVELFGGSWDGQGGAPRAATQLPTKKIA